MAKRVIVIGGGISGLTAAYRLQELKQEGHDLEVTLLEASDRLGGVIQTEYINGALYEKGAESFLAEKAAAKNLCERLGITDQIISTNEANRRSFVYWGKKLHRIPMGFYLIGSAKKGALLKLSHLSFFGKIRMLLEPLIPKKKNNRDESAASFIKRRYGKEAFERIGEPMISGIYSANSNELSLRSTFSKFLDMEEEFGSVTRGLMAQGKTQEKEASGPRYSLFLSFKNGMNTLIDALSNAITDIEVRCNTRVKGLEKKDVWEVSLDEGEVIQADVIVLATPSYVSAKLLENVNSHLTRQLMKIKYGSVTTVNLLFNAKEVSDIPEGFGFVVPPILNKRIIGCTFVDQKFKGRVAEGKILLRAFVKELTTEKQMSERVLIKTVRDELSEMMGLTQSPISYQIKRYIKSMPQYIVGHSELLKQIDVMRKKSEGLYLTGNAYQGIGIPDCIQNAEKVVEELVHA